MPRFAHTENGYTMDCQDAADMAEYLARFSVEVTAAWTTQSIDADIQDYATPKEGGGWKNRESPVPAPQPIGLAGKEFHAYCAGILGTVNANGPVQGMARMGAIVRGMRNAGPEVDGTVEIAYQRYMAASAPGGKFTYPDVPPLVQALAGAGLCEVQEATALADPATWPKR